MAENFLSERTVNVTASAFCLFCGWNCPPESPIINNMKKKYPIMSSANSFDSPPGPWLTSDCRIVYSRAQSWGSLPESHSLMRLSPINEQPGTFVMRRDRICLVDPRLRHVLSARSAGRSLHGAGKTFVYINGHDCALIFHCHRMDCYLIPGFNVYYQCKY